jgi:hypothetical protein
VERLRLRTEQAALAKRLGAGDTKVSASVDVGVARTSDVARRNPLSVAAAAEARRAAERKEVDRAAAKAAVTAKGAADVEAWARAQATRELQRKEAERAAERARQQQKDSERAKSEEWRRKQEAEAARAAELKRAQAAATERRRAGAAEVDAMAQSKVCQLTSHTLIHLEGLLPYPYVLDVVFSVAGSGTPWFTAGRCHCLGVSGRLLFSCELVL